MFVESKQTYQPLRHLKLRNIRSERILLDRDLGLL